MKRKRKIWFGVFLRGKIMRGPAATFKKAQEWLKECRSLAPNKDIRNMIYISRYSCDRDIYLA